MKKYIIILASIILSFSTALSLDVPKLKGRVNDYASMLSQQEKQELEQTLKNIETNTSAQLVLLTMPSLGDENLEDYTMRVAEEWKLGQEKKDNGVILFIALKERRIRIEVGYGLEPVLPDGRAGTIIRNIITPAFKQGQFYQGFTDAFLAMNSYITGSDTVEQFAQKYGEEVDDTFIEIIMIFIIVFVFILIFTLVGRKSMRSGRGIHLTGGSSWSSSSSSSGSSFSSGGFSGGGGSFGGGGASGGW
jgi:uncharacterized protein